MKNSKTLTVDAKAELAKRQLERTSTMAGSQNGGLLPRGKKKSNSDDSESKSEGSLSSSLASSSSNSDKGQDNAPQGQKDFSML
jgi:hypothetical protein